MKTRFLFPYRFRFIGMFLLVTGVAGILIVSTSDSYYNSIYDIKKVDDISKVINSYLGCIPAIIAGLMVIAFSKEKVEDEQIAQVRLDSLQWAVYVNYYALIIYVFFGHGIGVIPVVAFNLLTPIVFFIIRFRWKIYQNNRLLKREGELL